MTRTRRGVILVGRGARAATRGLDFARTLAETLAPEGWRWEVPHLDSAEALEAAAADATRARVDALLVAGGDGTLRNAVRGALASGAPRTDALPRIGLLPFGTVNCVARDLGMPRSTLPLLPHILDALRSGRTRPYDLAFVERNGTREPFLLSVGFGLEGAAIQATTPEAKRRWGAAAFIAAGFRLDLSRLPRVRVEAPGISLEGTQVTIVNSAHYGGPFQPFRGSSHDGLLDLLVHSKPTHLGLLGVCLRAAAGRLPGLRLRELEVRAIDRAAFHWDGDDAGTLEPGESIRIRVEPNALAFY